MATYSVVCPECRTSLKTPKPIPAGTPLECPKCQVMFAAPKPRAAAAKPAGKPSAFTAPLHRDQIGDVVDDVEVIDDDVEVIDEVEVVDDDAPPRRKKAAPPPARRKPVNRGVEVVDDDEDDDFDDRPRKKFKAKRKSGSNKGLMIGLVVGGLLLLFGGLGGLAYWLFTGGPGGEEPLAYMPPDSQVVGGFNLGALARDVPSLGQQLNMAATQMNAGVNFKEEAGIEPKEMFDQVFFGAKNNGGTWEGTIVSLSSKPFDRSKLNGRQQQGMSRKSAFGQTYFQPTDGSNPFKAMLVPSKRNLVLTTLAEPRFEPIFRSDGKKIALTGQLPALAAKVRSSHVWVVANVDDALKQQLTAMASQPMPGMPAGGAANAASELNGVTGLAISASVQGGNLDFRVGLECADASTAQAKATKAQTDMPKQMAALSALALFKPEARPLVEQLKSSLKIAANGTTAEISMQVSVANLETLVSSLVGAGQPNQPQNPQPNPNNNQRRGPQRRGVNRGG